MLLQDRVAIVSGFGPGMAMIVRDSLPTMRA
jgi:hypothetical protein